MFNTFSKPPEEEFKNSLSRALDELNGKYKAAIMYAAHLNALLREACEILEGLEVTVDVSEPLAFWWEKEKRKQQAAGSVIVSSDGTPIRDRMGPDEGANVDQPVSGSSEDQSNKVVLAS